MFVILLHAAHTLLRVTGLPVFPLALFTAVAARATTATDGKRRLIVVVLKTTEIAFPSHSLSNFGALGFVAVFCLPVLSLAFLGTVRRLAPRTKPKTRLVETDLFITMNALSPCYSSSSPRIDRGER